MHVWAAILAGLAGLAGGSFATVLITRIPDREAVFHPLARCPRCARRLPAGDLVPIVSWLRLGGRCRHCRARIGARYLVVELAAAALFAALGLRFGFTPALPAYLYYAGVAVTLAAVDIERQRLPNALTLPSYPIGIGLLGVAAVFTEAGLDRFAGALIGMAGLWIVYAALFLVHPRGMGWGDVKLAGVCGLYLGWLGFDVWAVGALSAFILGAGYGLALVGLRRASRKTPIPFGPFMIAGTVFAVLAGDDLAAAYLRL